MEDGTLEYEVNGIKLGIAFKNEELKTGPWFLTVCSNYPGNTALIINPPDSKDVNKTPNKKYKHGIKKA